MRRLVRQLGLAGEFATAAGRLTLIEAMLRRSTLPATCTRLGLRLDLRSASVPASEPVVLPRWAMVPVRACVGVATRWPAGDTCLRRCLLIGHRLSRLDPVLRIGVRRDETGTFVAHSWLEFDGRTLDPGISGFATLGCIVEGTRPTPDGCVPAADVTNAARSARSASEQRALG